MRELEPILRASAANGWTDLVTAIRRVLSGSREQRILQGLDEEDRTIVEAILRGLQDPRSLPRPDAAPDPGLAAPGLAAMIHAASRGDTRALQFVAGMAEQMSRAGGDMARLAAAVRPLINGERDPGELCRGMSAQGESLVMSILAELAQLQVH